MNSSKNKLNSKINWEKNKLIKQIQSKFFMFFFFLNNCVRVFFFLLFFVLIICLVVFLKKAHILLSTLRGSAI